MYKLILSLVFLSGVAHASSAYDCGALKISVGLGKIKVLGLSEAGGKATDGEITKYRPSAKNAGSTRYDISSICQSSGDVYAILDKDLSAGKPFGRMIIQSSCDADGGMPTFDRYTCRSK